MPQPTFVVPAAGALPGFGFDHLGRLQVIGDPERARTGVFNPFSPLLLLQQQQPPYVVDDEVDGVVAAAPAAALGHVATAASVTRPVVAAAVAVADARGRRRWRWSAAPWYPVAVVLLALLFFALLPVAGGGSRLLPGAERRGDGPSRWG